MSDEEIKLALTVEANNAIEQIRKVRAEIDLAKKDILALSAETKNSLEVTAKGMLRQFSSEKMKSIPLFGDKKSITEAVNAAKAAIASYRSTLTMAVAEIKQAETSEFKAVQTQQVQKQKLIETVSKQRLAQEKQVIAEIKANEQGLQKTLSAIEQQKIKDAERSSKERAKYDTAKAKEILATQKKTQTTTKETTSVFGKLGDVGKFVFGSILGITAISVLRNIIQYFKDAAQSGYDFSKALFQLSAGVNALRRSGTDITFKDVMTNIKAIKKEFPIFSIPELVAGTSALINLTRAFGFTKEQVFELQDTIIKLAIINGRAMDDVQRTVALAISSGYTEGLQRLGVSINRINIAEKAAALGYADSYMALTELERAEATRLLILEKTSLYQDDLNEYQKQFPGLIDASNASLKDMSAQIGLSLLPIWALFMRVIQGAANFFSRVFGEVIPNILSNFTVQFMTVVGIFKQGWEIISGKRTSIDWSKIGEEARKTAELVRGYFAGEAFTLPEPEINKGGLKQFTDEQLDAYESLFKDIIDLQEDYNDKYKETQLDFLADLVKLDQEYNEKRKEIWQDYYDEIAKINADATQEIAEEERDLQNSIEDLNRDTQNSISDANRKYRENEIKAERDYQEKLRRLREEFLFDLEDALRERDALQVLRLIRRYNLDKAQLSRQGEQEKQERAENYRSELEDIRRHAAEKLRELQTEHQRRLQEIEEQRQRELAEAEKKREEELAQAREDWLAQREERTKQYVEDIQDLHKWLEDRLTEISTKFLEMNGVTDEMSNMLAKTIQSVFGEGGLAGISFNQFNAMLDYAINNAIAKEAQLAQMLANINAMSASILSAGTLATNPQGTNVAPNALNPTPGTVWTGGHASGASNMILTRPKLIMAGEVPERVDITPLNQLGGNGSGKGKLEILLGAGLEGRIVDNALGQVEIVLRKELERH